MSIYIPLPLTATEEQMMCRARQEEFYDLITQLTEVTKERDTWKANHDNQVKINQLLRDRPDLKERAGLVDRLIKERDQLRQERDHWKSKTVNQMMRNASE